MRYRGLVCALLLAALMMLAIGAQAETAVVFPVKGGLMLVGQSVTLTPKLSGLTLFDLTWASSDAEVLKAEGNTVTAQKPGRAIITATADDAGAKCGVVVLPDKLEMKVGESYELPRGGIEMYRTKNESVATVSETGAVTAVAAGETLLGVKLGRQVVTLPVTVAGAAVAAQDGSQPGGISLPEETSQVVLVDYAGGSDARLSIYEKRNGAWAQLYECDAYVGKNGVGKTVEGDKKTPLGVYNLTTPFGIKEDPGAGMPYTQVTQYHYWCGDSDSGYYNQLVDERVVDRKHTSADEYLIDYKGVYNYCMFIDYNAQGEAHKGSCIFLHCTGSNKYTAGCVAVPEHVMEKIIRWAKEGTKIVIVE